MLIDAAAPTKAKIGFGVRPLMYAAGNGEAGVVEVLLRAGADPLARNEVGRNRADDGQGSRLRGRDQPAARGRGHARDLGELRLATRNAPDMQVVTFLRPPRTS